MRATLELLRQRWMLLMLAVLSPVFAILCVEEMRPILADVGIIGVGWGASGVNFVIGGVVFWRFIQLAFDVWCHDGSAVPWSFYGRELAKWLIVLPVATLLGRIVCSIIPPYEPLIGCVLFPVLALYFFAGVGLFGHAPPDSTFRRGLRQLTLDQATAIAKGLPRGEDAPIAWAGFELPGWTSEGHFCVVGAPGAGKTRMIRTLMASVLPQIRPGTDRRAIVYDVKLDAISELNTMQLACPIRILNPFDTRCVAWDMAADLRDPATADQYAAILFPEQGDEKGNFFTHASRLLVGGVLKAFIIGQRQWTLRDLIHVTASKERLKQVLQSTPHTATLIDRFFKPEDTFGNILATIANGMVRLESVAAVWDGIPPDRRFSIDSWCRNESSVLVLGRSFDRSETLTVLNQILFRRISEVLLSGEESPGRWKMWFFIDELEEGGQLDGLPQLLNDGRSKGVRIALGFQDIEGLRQTYGEHLANKMPGLCANRSMLHLRSSFTAEWASDQIGEVENFEYVTSFGQSCDADGKVTQSDNTTKNIEARRAILPSEFFSFARSTGGNVFGCHVISDLGGYLPRISRHALHEADSAVDFAARKAVSEMLLSPWTDEDARRLGLRILHDTNQDLNQQPAPDLSPLDRIERLRRAQAH